MLVSGRGSNLQAIIDEIESGKLPVEIALVVSNHAGAFAVQRAEGHGIPTLVLEKTAFKGRKEHQLAIAEALIERGVELVVLAGFDRILHPAFIRKFPLKIINVHPSLLPAFAGGLHAQEEAYNYGVKITGCTVHFSTEEVDAGPIILQAAVPVEDDDTVETLAARILTQEHRILPEAIGLIASRSVRIEGRRVIRGRDLGVGL